MTNTDVVRRVAPKTFPKHAFICMCVYKCFTKYLVYTTDREIAATSCV